MNEPKKTVIKNIAENKKAKSNYQIEDTFECGIELLGSEVKSLRLKHVTISDSYAIIKNHELWLLGLKIEPYKQATHDHIEKDRTRKLLLHKKEILRLEKLQTQKKFNLIPLKLYFKNAYAKVLLGIGISKTKIDKRDTIKDKEAKIAIARVMRRGG